MTAPAGSGLDILPLQPEQFADPATGRDARDDQVAQMRSGMLKQSLFFAGLPRVGRFFEPAITRSLVREFHDDLPAALERRLIDIAFLDGPCEQMPQSFEQPIDAHFAAFVARQQSRDETRPLVLLFTDGDDTVSWLTAGDVIETARRAGLVIHAVCVEPDPFLGRLVEATGGRTWLANSDRQLRELFTKALEEMRARYPLNVRAARRDAAGWRDQG